MLNPGYSLSLSSKPRPDHSLKSLNLGLRHVVAALEVMRREQEHVLDACLFPCLQEALRATFRRTEQSECIGNLARLILRDCRGIVRWLELEPGLFQPVKIRCARIGEKGLT
jgi:hypothetical protein